MKAAAELAVSTAEAAESAAALSQESGEVQELRQLLPEADYSAMCGGPAYHCLDPFA